MIDIPSTSYTALIEEYDIGLPELAYLYIIDERMAGKVLRSLEGKQLIQKTPYIQITPLGIKVLSSIKNKLSILDSRSKSIRDLSRTLIDLYPKYKRSSGHCIANNISEVMRHFALLYEATNIIPDSDKAIQATKDYIDAVEDIYYMKDLKYFIFKSEGDSFSSDLLTYIENQEQ